MSTIPPSTPAGGAPPPFPPYESKTQWRAYREQQKAAWRAQREAWKAQQRAMKANYIGAYGPRVPSVVGPVILIAVGVVALLLLTGHINTGEFWEWNHRWWPLLLIGAGLALLGEWVLDLRRETPVRRGGGFVVILILFVLFELSVAGWHHMGPWFSDWDDHDNDFFNAFSLPEHDNEQKTLSQQIPPNAAIDIQNPRGDVTITAGDGSAIEVQAHEVAYANSVSEAQKIFDAEAAQLKVAGSAVSVRSSGSSNGRLDLTIIVPRNAKVTVDTSKGDVNADGLNAGIKVTAHGGVKLNAITGSVEARFSDGKHDFSAQDIRGDVNADGNLEDLTLSGIKGKITQNGEIFGEVRMDNVSGPIHLHTTVTDLQLAELPGDLTLDTEKLSVNEAKGQVRVVTHSKDVELSEIHGDSFVEDRDGNISVEPAGNYSVDAKNMSGDGNLEVTLPQNASAIIDGRTHNGEIYNDFDLSVSGDESKTVSGKLGSGSARITLNTAVGNISLKKRSALPAAPNASSPEAPSSPKAPAANVPPYPKTPALANAPRLKEPKVPPAPQ